MGHLPSLPIYEEGVKEESLVRLETPINMQVVTTPRLTLNITASVPSMQALATSEHSARVGRGLLIILSNICVAVITGLPLMEKKMPECQYKPFIFEAPMRSCLPARLASRIIIFCAKKTFEGGISMPKSPRATIIPADSEKKNKSQEDVKFKVETRHDN